MEKAKKIRSIVAGCLAAVTLATAGLAVATDGFKSFKKNDNIQMELPEENNGGTVIGESAGNGVKVMSAKIAKEDYVANGESPLAETAYTLTATVTPADADLSFSWSVEFVNPSSEWATGKTVTDYVTVASASNNTATVTCKQAFGSQIKVIAKVTGNETAKAECTVDYTKKLTSVSAKLLKNVNNLDTEWSSDNPNSYLKFWAAWTQPYKTANATTQTTVGTIDDTYTYTMHLKYSADFITKAKAANIKIDEAFDIDCYNDDIMLCMVLFDDMLVDSILDGNSRKVLDVPAYNNAVRFIQTNSTPFEVTVTATGKYSTKTNVYPCKVDFSSMRILAETVSLDHGNIIF